MYVPAVVAVMEHVAVATFADPANVALEVVHAVTPAVPLTVKTTVPLGVAPLVGPVRVAVKTTLPPSAVTPLLVTTLVGVALTIVAVLVADVTVT
jgi:hypothetical protein